MIWRAMRIGLSDNAGELDRRMPSKTFFDFPRADPIACSCNHIIVSCDEADPITLLFHSVVTGEKPSLHETLRRVGSGSCPIASEHAADPGAGS